MRNARFLHLVDEALAQSLSGWDFAWIQNRWALDATTWNYRELVQERILAAESLLDMCTGGGEFLASLEQLPETTYATEGFAPNIELARQRLKRLGAEVVAFESDDNLPLPGDTFDLVINRHGSYSVNELKRIAKKSGMRFVTQQVGADNAIALNEALGAGPPTHVDWSLERASAELESEGFELIRAKEQYPEMSFRDIGALVFYLRAIPWQIPDFHISIYESELLAIHRRIESTGSYKVNAHRFLLEATYH